MATPRLSDCWRTAYHESGHCASALNVDPLSATKLRIYREQGLWQGTANIATAGMDDFQVAAIALSGLLAEARAVAEARAKRRGSLDQNR